MKEPQEVTDRDTEIVAGIRARLVAELGDDRFELWFGPNTQIEWRTDSLWIVTDSAFRSEQLRRGLLCEIRQALRLETNCEARVIIDVDPSLAEVRASTPEVTDADGTTVHPCSTIRSATRLGATGNATGTNKVREAEPSRWRHQERRPRRFAQLHSLIPGECNRMSLGASALVLKDPGQINPLFIHGPSGVGKTHLLEGIWSEVRRQGGRRIIYLTAEQFTTYFLQALRGSGLPNFRRKYRAVDLLIIDDIQFFDGKQATITELLYTLDTLLRDSGQIVVSADRPPLELSDLGSELITRIQGGLICPMQPLDPVTRRTLLQRLVAQREIRVRPSILDKIAERAAGDARQLSGLVNRLWATGQTLHTDLNDEIVDEILDEVFPHGSGVVRLDDIQRVVCREFGIEPDDLRSDRRARAVSHPRMLAMWLARKHTRAALTEIGEFFGRRSHSTVLSAQNKVERWVRQGESVQCQTANQDVRSLVSRLERNLGA